MFRDKAGRVLEAGDFIVYGTLLGRCAGLSYGIVLEQVRGKSAAAYGEEADKIRVRGAQEQWRGMKNALQLNTKDSTLAFGERVCWVPEHALPQALSAELNQVWMDYDIAKVTK